MINDVIAVDLNLRRKYRLQIHRVHPSKEPIRPESLSFSQRNEHGEFLLGWDGHLHGGLGPAEHDPIEEFLRSHKEWQRVRTLGLIERFVEEILGGRCEDVGV